MHAQIKVVLYAPQKPQVLLSNSDNINWYVLNIVMETCWMNTCTAFCHSAGTYKILSFLNTDIKNVYTNITTMLTIAINEHRMCGESLSNKHNLLAAQLPSVKCQWLHMNLFHVVLPLSQLCDKGTPVPSVSVFAPLTMNSQHRYLFHYSISLPLKNKQTTHFSCLRTNKNQQKKQVVHRIWLTQPHKIRIWFM